MDKCVTFLESQVKASTATRTESQSQTHRAAAGCFSTHQCICTHPEATVTLSIQNNVHKMHTISCSDYFKHPQQQQETQNSHSKTVPLGKRFVQYKQETDIQKCHSISLNTKDTICFNFSCSRLGSKFGII